MSQSQQHPQREQQPRRISNKNKDLLLPESTIPPLLHFPSTAAVVTPPTILPPFKFVPTLRRPVAIWQTMMILDV